MSNQLRVLATNWYMLRQGLTVCPIHGNSHTVATKVAKGRQSYYRIQFSCGCVLPYWLWWSKEHLDEARAYCDKFPYIKESEAQSGAERQSAKAGVPLWIYQCRTCGLFHLTSQDQSLKDGPYKYPAK